MKRTAILESKVATNLVCIFPKRGILDAFSEVRPVFRNETALVEFCQSLKIF